MKKNKTTAPAAPERVAETRRYRIKALINKGMGVKEWEKIINAVDLSEAVAKFINLNFFNADGAPIRLLQFDAIRVQELE